MAQTDRPIISSILDSDLYKFTQQQCILFGRSNGISYQDVDVVYEFINRGKTRFPGGFARILRDQVLQMSSVRLDDREFRWLRDNIPYLKRSYLEFLRGFRFDPTQVKISDKDSLEIRVEGPWYSTVLWEVPLMAIISELFFMMTEQNAIGVADKTKSKAEKIRTSGITVSDFGTRRRHSLAVQDEVIRILANEAGPTFVGTSNVAMAMRHKLKPIGTHAHELFMGHAALFGYRLANRYTLNTWANEYVGELGIALTDTFTSDIFFNQFDKSLSKLFDGVRQDSGVPEEFAQKAIDHYIRMKIDPLSKTVVFSDGLTVDRAIEIAEWCRKKIKSAFGIGTSLTNDCGCIPLNIVIKLVKCNGIDTVKLSDTPGKNTGTAEAITNCKYTLGIDS